MGMGETCSNKAHIIQPKDVEATVDGYYQELESIEHFTTQYIKTFIISLKLS